MPVCLRCECARAHECAARCFLSCLTLIFLEMSCAWICLSSSSAANALASFYSSHTRARHTACTHAHKHCGQAQQCARACKRRRKQACGASKAPLRRTKRSVSSMSHTMPSAFFPTCAMLLPWSSAPWARITCVKQRARERASHGVCEWQNKVYQLATRARPARKTRTRGGPPEVHRFLLRGPTH